jgi:hypothetical protein
MVEGCFSNPGQVIIVALTKEEKGEEKSTDL